MKGMRPFTDEEIDLVFEKLGGKRKRYGARNKLLFMFGLKTGLRITEILSVKVSDVMTEGKVNKTVYIQRKNLKGKREGRILPLHDVLGPLIRHWVKKAQLKPDDYLFISQRTGQQMKRESVHRLFKKVYSLLGLEGSIGLHGMRKKFAKTIFERTGHNILAVQRALGHSNVATTLAYLEPSQDEVNEAILAG
jgi:integrase